MPIRKTSVRRRSMRRLTATMLLAGLVATAFVPRRDDIYFAIKKNFTIFGSLYEELAGGYVDPVDPERFMRVGIESMLSTLDPYTTFINEAQIEDIDIRNQGRMGGIGVDVASRNGTIVIVSPLEGYSGFRQGLRAGDVILSVDGRSVGGLNASDVTELLRGDPGSTVRLRVEREGEPEPIEFVLMRSRIKVNDVSYSDFVGDPHGDGIGYIRLDRFGRQATKEVHDAIRAFEERAQLKGLILDLRENPGGLLDAAVAITGSFVEQGATIVSTRGRLSETQRVYRNTHNPVLPDLPLVVLINEFSASASEIVAGAIQDLDRGVIVGERSFGKGLVQVIRPLPYNTSLKLTTSRYYTPSGRSIQSILYRQGSEQHGAEVPDSLRNTFRTAAGRFVRDGGGIEPDVRVPEPEMSELETALVRRAAFFRFANAFAARRDSVPPDFEVTDDVVEEFRQWLGASTEFSYETRSERALESLGEALDGAAYAGASRSLEAVQTELQREKDGDFDRHAEAIRERLRTEILSRFHGETVQVRASMAFDTQFQRALGVLRDRGSYQELLSAATN